ncbi:hypothetical protein PIIN_01521 [Serendipita indica DSM 11827]|uniref:Uncharacterized protein n=1 Tax=Serendipita indica (strain DSM 11827) TaxID=1109443 RepID=G4T8P2_SERID|nr:hypothetical protein PIIN_01521 [Serendipita indica DSM 11827]
MASVIPSVTPNARSTLQREYFTSELFVNPARSDIEDLLASFEEAVEQPLKPFDIFKTVWSQEGWKFTCLYIWEDTARDQYLQTMLRLFLERVKDSESFARQLGAVFGLYTFFQQQATIKSLYSVSSIEITIDKLEYLCSLCKESPVAHQPYYVFILRYFLERDIFHILPHSSLQPYNPTRLPASFVVSRESSSGADASSHGGNSSKTTRGGRTKAERDRYGREQWAQLGSLVRLQRQRQKGEVDDVEIAVGAQPHSDANKNTSGSTPFPDKDSSAVVYREAKSRVLEVLPKEVEREAEQRALQRLKTLASSVESDVHSGLKKQRLMETDDSMMEMESVTAAQKDNQRQREEGDDEGGMVSQAHKVSHASDGVARLENMIKNGHGVLRNQWANE